MKEPTSSGSEGRVERGDPKELASPGSEGRVERGDPKKPAPPGKAGGTKGAGMTDAGGRESCGALSSLDAPPVEITESTPEMFPCSWQVERRMRWRGGRILDDTNVVEMALLLSWVLSVAGLVFLPIFVGKPGARLGLPFLTSGAYFLLSALLASFLDVYWVADPNQRRLCRVWALGDLWRTTLSIPYADVAAVELRVRIGGAVGRERQYRMSRGAGLGRNERGEARCLYQHLVLVDEQGATISLTAPHEVTGIEDGAGKALAEAIGVPFRQPEVERDQLARPMPSWQGALAWVLALAAYGGWMLLSMSALRLLGVG